MTPNPLNADVYRLCYKGAGFYKYNVISARKVNTNDKYITFACLIRGTHWRPKAKNIPVMMMYDNGNFCFASGLYFTNLVDYYLGVVGKERKKNKQYFYELNEYKHKHPEYFL